jgi:hypothetical protein
MSPEGKFMPMKQGTEIKHGPFTIYLEEDAVIVTANLTGDRRPGDDASYLEKFNNEPGSYYRITRRPQ